MRAPRFAIVLTAAFGMAAGIVCGQTPTYRDLHDFGGRVTNADAKSGPDGMFPGPVGFDRAGNMYGAATNGGANGATNGGGTVWMVSASGVYRDLHDFGGTVVNADGQSGPDGEEPYASVAVDSAGDLFGTATTGGPNRINEDGAGGGMVWEISAAGVYIDLHDFGGKVTNASGKSGADGASPVAGVTLDGAGNLYGTTSVGGPNRGGIVWGITKGGGYRDIHDFGGSIVDAAGERVPDGVLVDGGVTFDSAGDMYGAAASGGAGEIGMVWEITRAGTYKDLHDFGGRIFNADGIEGFDGGNPYAGVALDSAGNLFGTACYGGRFDNFNPFGDGIVWEITASGTYRDLHDFGGTIKNADGKTGADGANPDAAVTFDPAGNMYGTAAMGGPTDANSATGDGIVWEVSSSGAYADLHDFGGAVSDAGGQSGPDGIEPDGGVSLDPGGNLYGTCTFGGPDDADTGGDGMAWGLSRASVAGLVVSPSSLVGGSAAVGTVTLTTPAPIGGMSFALASNSVAASLPASIMIAAGRTSATFPLKTSSVAANTMVTLVAKCGAACKTAGLVIYSPVLAGVSMNPATVTGGSSSTGTVMLDGPAPSSGITVALSSSAASVTAPALVVVPAGKTTVTFTVKTTAVKQKTAATVTAQAGSATKRAVLTVNP